VLQAALELRLRQNRVDLPHRAQVPGDRREPWPPPDEPPRLVEDEDAGRVRPDDDERLAADQLDDLHAVRRERRHPDAGPLHRKTPDGIRRTTAHAAA
jgi:hypothetical protein